LVNIEIFSECYGCIGMLIEKLLVMLVQSPVVCSVSVVGEVGERTPMAPRTGSSGKGGGLITSPVVFSSVELSGTGVSRAKN
jgi:hypothetical protein